MVIGPNNRCENVYNCFQFPADGSAVGIHLLDPYISLSSHTVVKPNEPSTAMVAVDNNGHNWLPSMHFGLNDDAGPNLLNNSAFEGWGSSTSLYYWGGVSGTNINQAGSGIYAQNASSGSPTADLFTQGTYNVVIGDNATAGLGINSGCIQVDATMNYTLAFRIAAASTGIAFRPGFRFYSDANCTEAESHHQRIVQCARAHSRELCRRFEHRDQRRQLAEHKRVAHVQQWHHLQLQRNGRGLERRHGESVDRDAATTQSRSACPTPTRVRRRSRTRCASSSWKTRQRIRTRFTWTISR